MQGFKAIVRYGDRRRYMKFVPDEKLTKACERIDEDPREVRRVLDFPPGNYTVTSLSHPGGAYLVSLDPESGRLRNHKCEYLINQPQDFCAHFVKAFTRWQEEQEQALDEGEWEEINVDEATALAIREAPDTALLPQPSLPSKDEWVALGRLAMQLYENGRGALIPNDVKNWQHLTGLMLYGREMGFDPMTSLKVVYMIGGRFELNSHGKRAMVQRTGGDIQYEYGDGSVTATLTRPGRKDTTVTYTIAQAKLTPEYDRNANWKSRPEDMLVAAATNRVCRRGAADVINAIDWASKRAPTVHNMPMEVHEEVSRQSGQHLLSMDIDPDTGEIIEHYEELREESPSPTPIPTSGASPEPSESRSHESPTAPAATPPPSTPSAPVEPPQQARTEEAGVSSPEPGPASEPVAPAASTATTDERGLNYKAVMQDKAKHITVLSAFQRAIRGLGTVPEDADNMSLDQIVNAMGGSWPQKGN